MLFAAVGASDVRAVRNDACDARHESGPDCVFKPGERGVAGGRERFSVQRTLVVTQIAVSMVFLVGALLFVRSYRNLTTLDPGIREWGIVVGYFEYRRRIKQENEAAFKRQLVEDVRSVPGVENAAATNNTPLGGGSWSQGYMWMDP